MPRQRTGTLRRKRSARGVSYGVQFSYRGEEHYVYLGGSLGGLDASSAPSRSRAT